MKPLIPLDTEIKPWGKLVGIHSRNGERQYFFIDIHNVVSLIPADLVEKEYFREIIQMKDRMPRSSKSGS